MQAPKINPELVALALLVVLLILLCGGCRSFDSSIRHNPKTGDIDMRLPKDATWDVLKYRKEFQDVLGRPVITELIISNASFKMNPLVIDAATRRDVELIKAGADVGAKLLQAMPK